MEFSRSYPTGISQQIAEADMRLQPSSAQPDIKEIYKMQNKATLLTK